MSIGWKPHNAALFFAMNNSKEMSLFHLWVICRSHQVLYGNYIHVSSLCLQTAAGCRGQCGLSSLIDKADTFFLYSFIATVNSLHKAMYYPRWSFLGPGLSCKRKGSPWQHWKCTCGHKVNLSAYAQHRFPFRQFRVPLSGTWLSNVTNSNKI